MSRNVDKYESDSVSMGFHRVLYFYFFKERASIPLTRSLQTPNTIKRFSVVHVTSNITWKYIFTLNFALLLLTQNDSLSFNLLYTQYAWKMNLFVDKN